MYTTLSFCDVFPFEFFVIKIDSIVIICDHRASLCRTNNLFPARVTIHSDRMNLNPIL